MEHVLHEQFSHKTQAFEALCKEFEQEHGRVPDTHERARILSDAICEWSREEVDLRKG